MKKSLIVLTAALSFGFAAAQTDATASAPQVPALTDVPAGHWAKDAIDRLVGRGIILGYPDGTYRGTQNLTRYEAAVIIARLLDQMQTGQVPQGTLNTEELTALQNAIQELAADLTALGVRVSDLEENAVSRDDFSRLEARVEELAATSGEQEAIEGLTTQITELTTRVDELGGNYDALRADVDDNASSIAALNDLTVLLNQDILNIQDRVSAVEAAQADFVTRADFDNITGQLSGRIDATNTRVDVTNTRVDAVDARVTGVADRVTTLENAPKFTVTAGLESGYSYLTRVAGSTDFDVDRLDSPINPFGDDDITTVDTSAPSATGASKVGALTFGIKGTNLATATGSVLVRNAAINFGLSNVLDTSSPVKVVPVVSLSSASADGTIGGQNFTVDYNRTERKFKFSDYLLNNSGDALAGPSLLATLDATALPLQPKITVVTGTTTSPVASNIAYGTTTPAVANAAVATDYAGFRAEVKPNADSRLGVSYATSRGNRSALGTDYSLKLGGFLTVKGEGVLSTPSIPLVGVVAGTNEVSNVLRDSDKAFYTDVTGDLGIAKFGVNFRTIDPAFAVQNDATKLSATVPANAGLSRNGGPYGADQVGFGGAIATNNLPVALGAYGDTFTPHAGGTRTTAFGAKAGVQFGALSLVAFYNSATVGTTPVARDLDATGRNAGMGIADVPLAYSSSAGARLKHDGTATNALVRNLNFTIQDGYYYRQRTNDFQAYADYTATIGGLTLNPLVRFRSITNSDNTLAVLSDEGTTFKVGARVSTAPFAGVPLQPSFFGDVMYRTTNPTNTAVDTTELLARTGLTLNQFLAPNTSASLGYSYYQGRNVAGTAAAVGVENKAFAMDNDTIFAGVGGESGRVQGVYGALGFNGLTANYGVFRHTALNAAGQATGQTSIAQGFKVAYTFKF